MAKDINKEGRSEDIGKSEDIENKNGSETTETDPEEKKKRKLKPVHWVIIIALVLALIAALVYFFWLRGVEQDIDDRGTALGGGGMLLTPDNIDEVRQMMEEPGPDAQYTVSMTTNWTFDTWQTPSSDAIVNNLESNSRTVYFDVTLRDTDELVYSSPYIPLGQALVDFALDANPGAGVHDAIVRFFLVDDDNEVVADVAVSVTLTING